MSDLTLVLGSKNLSSWSLRPWLLMRRIGADFDEVVIPLDQPETGDLIRQHSPVGLVPLLKHGELTVWDSLAITEYVAELYPEAGVWPADRSERARARAFVAEMHSGFDALRSQMPMAFKDSLPAPSTNAKLARDIERVVTIWSSLRAQYTARGDFLLGHFTAVDAFFAPVVSRFRTYGVDIGGSAAAYLQTMWRLPEMQEWLDAASHEG